MTDPGTGAGTGRQVRIGDLIGQVTLATIRCADRHEGHVIGISHLGARDGGRVQFSRVVRHQRTVEVREGDQLIALLRRLVTTVVDGGHRERTRDEVVTVNLNNVIAVGVGHLNVGIAVVAHRPGRLAVGVGGQLSAGITSHREVEGSLRTIEEVERTGSTSGEGHGVFSRSRCPGPSVTPIVTEGDGVVSRIEGQGLAGGIAGGEVSQRVVGHNRSITVRDGGRGLTRTVAVRDEREGHVGGAGSEALVDVRVISRACNAQVGSLRVEDRDGLGLRVAVAGTVRRGPCALEHVAVGTVTIGADFSIEGRARIAVAVVADAQAGDRGHSRNGVTLHIHHVCGEGSELGSRAVVDCDLLYVLCEVLIAVVHTVCTDDGVLLSASRGQDDVFVGHEDLGIAVVQGLGMESIARRVLRNGITVDVSGQGGVAALEGQVAGGEREFGGRAVRRHHNLLDRSAVATHIVGRVVDDVVIGASTGERRAIDIHVAQLAVVRGRGQTDAVQVIVVASTGNPEVTLDCIHLVVSEARGNLILDVNALVVAGSECVSAAVRRHGRPCADDAVATSADAVHHVVGVAQTGGREVTVVTVGRRSRARVARIEVHETESVHIERNVGGSRHGHLGLRVVLDGDRLHVEGLVAEAIRSHPSTGQHTTAAGGVGSGGLTHELDTHEVVVSIGESSRIGIESSSTSVLAVITIVTEEDHLCFSRVGGQPSITISTIQGDIITAGHVGRSGHIVAVHRLNVQLRNVAELVKGDVVEFHELAILTIRSVIHGGLEGGNDVTGLAVGGLTRDGTTPAEPSGESVVVTVVVVGSVTQLVTEVLAGRLVVETQQRSELPVTTTRGIAHVVIEDVHGPEVRIHGTTVVVLEASTPSRTCGAVLEVEMDVETTVGVVHVDHSTLEEGGSVLVLGHRDTTGGEVLHEVSGLTHVTIDVIELQQGVDTVVEVRIITGGNDVPGLAGTTTVLFLVAAVELQLGAVDSIELKLGASEGSHIIGSHGSVQLGLTLH